MVKQHLSESLQVRRGKTSQGNRHEIVGSDDNWPCKERGSGAALLTADSYSDRHNYP